MTPSRHPSLPHIPHHSPPTTTTINQQSGFSAAECARDLLPHFLDFSPAGTRVVFAVGPFDEPPPEFDYEGVVEEDELREGGLPPVLHQVHYRCVCVCVERVVGASCLEGAEGVERDRCMLCIRFVCTCACGVCVCVTEKVADIVAELFTKV